MRERSEEDAGHAPTAQPPPPSTCRPAHTAHRPPPSTLAESLEKLPETDDELDIVCRSGGRSFQVAQWLNANGF
ncbi:MAG: rhodanese-like domain-containing protein, partial [Brachybacterium tyrofermentans]